MKPEEIFRFVELACPELEADFASKWFVKTLESGGYVYCLSTDGNRVFAPMTTSDRVDYLFDSEEDAYFAICSYYTKHDERYPYVDEWNELHDDNKHQVMDFI